MKKLKSSAKRSPGRPRSEGARVAILGATLTLLEQYGYPDLTVEAIAKEAGASKATVYRWWSSKADLVMDAYLTMAEGLTPLPDEGSLEADLRSYASTLVGALNATSAGHIMGGLVAAVQGDPALARTFREQFIQPRRDTLKGLLERGVERGELHKNANLEQIVDYFYAPIWYRLLITGAGVDGHWVKEHVSVLLKLFV